MKESFDSFEELDSQMVDGIKGVGEWLAQEVSAVLSLVDVGGLAEANRRIVADNRDVLPSRLAISRALSSLLDLQSSLGCPQPSSRA